MRELLSPKEIAQAIGVSESSVKRWADQGLLQANRTVGGHRRIPLAEAVRFIRERGAPVLRPEILGLPDAETGQADPIDGFEEYLRQGAAAQARGWLLSAYTAGTSLASLFDGPIRIALERIGSLCKQEKRTIFVVHRATEICHEAIHQLRFLFDVPPDAPTAVCAGIPGDASHLPTQMAATILQSEGFRAVNLGPNLPFDALDSAVEESSPRLLWIGAGIVRDPDEASRELGGRFRTYTRQGIVCLVGGPRGGEIPVPPIAGFHRARQMSDLVALARKISRRAGGAAER